MQLHWKSVSERTSKVSDLESMLARVADLTEKEQNSITSELKPATSTSLATVKLCCQPQRWLLPTQERDPPGQTMITITEVMEEQSDYV